MGQTFIFHIDITVSFRMHERTFIVRPGASHSVGAQHQQMIKSSDFSAKHRDEHNHSLLAQHGSTARKFEPGSVKIEYVRVRLRNLRALVALNASGVRPEVKI